MPDRCPPRLALLVALALTAAPAPADDNKRPGDTAQGAAVYARHCQACHGATARGDGPAASDLVAAVPDLGGRFAKGDIEPAIAVVRDGRAAMPAFGESLDQADIRRALRHLAVIAAAPVAPVAPVAPADPTPIEEGDL
jgi:mono/diheme cytochrome c family protein